MEINDWDEYRTNTRIMFSALEACIQQLVRTGNNISISRTGNLDNGKRVRVEIFNPIDVEVYIDYVNFREDVLKYLKKVKKYFRFTNGHSVREVFILDAGFGLTEYEFSYNEHFLRKQNETNAI
jgi:hypothetical protein|nr:MAG TPA: hypothetical protein [Caudoviricetes sp.]DAS28881.1 MAG TPA: hypothetical protein [Caudoviricetes sp.]